MIIAQAISKTWDLSLTFHLFFKLFIIFQAHTPSATACGSIKAVPTVRSKFTQLEILFFLFQEVSVHERWTEITECALVWLPRSQSDFKDRETNTISELMTENTTCLNFFVFCSPPVFHLSILLNNILHSSLECLIMTFTRQKCPNIHHNPFITITKWDIKRWIYCTSKFTCMSVHSHKALYTI